MKPLPYKNIDNRLVIDFENYCTYYLHVIGNKLSQQASRIYQRQSGLGVVEWRCLAVFAMHEDATASMVCQLSSMDKALVSRAIQKLRDKNYLISSTRLHKGKAEPLKITDLGLEVHSELLNLSIEREGKLRGSLSEEDIIEFLRVAKIMYKNTEEMDQS